MRGWFAAASVLLVLALFVGLNQAEARSIYYPYDKWLHAAVFFLMWWLARLSVPWHAAAVTLLVVGLGGAEELRQAFAPGRTADWADMAANTAGALLAAGLYGLVRALWLARQSVHHTQAADAQGTRAPHAVDWRFDVHLWHWRWYVVLLAGSSRRALSRQQRVVTGWVLGVGLAVAVLLLVALSAAVVLLISVSLGL